MLYWTDISEAVRALIQDNVATYRFSDDQLVAFGSEGIKELRRVRPSSQFNADLERTEFEDLSYGGLFDYTFTGGQLADYHKITGWSRETYPTLYLKSTSATQIGIFASSAHRTAGTPLLAHILQADTQGDKTVTLDNASGFGGRITNNIAATINETWEVTAKEEALEIDPMFKDPLVYFVSGKCFELDNEDTYDASRATAYMQKFYQLLTK